MSVHWKDWSWSWNSNTLATSCEVLTHWKRPWCWERLKVGGKGDDRGWDGWIASLTWWTWVWVNSESWWWTGRPGVLQSMGVTKNQTWLSDWTELGKFRGTSKESCSIPDQKQQSAINTSQSEQWKKGAVSAPWENVCLERVTPRSYDSE